MLRGPSELPSSTLTNKLSMSLTMHDYHDAILLDFAISWDSGTVVMKLALCSDQPRTIALTIVDVSELMFKRQFPWGRSVSVNSLKLEPVASGRRVVVDMQSGDAVVVVGRDVLEVIQD
jgi:hypothetical protein